jgi:hypothetical protein
MSKLLVEKAEIDWVNGFILIPPLVGERMK